MHREPPVRGLISKLAGGRGTEQGSEHRQLGRTRPEADIVGVGDLHGLGRPPTADRCCKFQYAYLLFRFAVSASFTISVSVRLG